jgi:hypothetical protein
LVSKATDAAIKAVRPDVGRLAAKAAERAVRNRILSSLPTLGSIENRHNVDIQIDVNTIVEAEVSRLTAACDARDLSTAVQNYPIKDSSLPSEIAKSLKFLKKADYEKAVRNLLEKDSKMKGVMSEWFADIHEAIG